MDDAHRALLDAELAALASVAVDDNSSFDFCHDGSCFLVVVVFRDYMRPCYRSSIYHPASP